MTVLAKFLNKSSEAGRFFRDRSQVTCGVSFVFHTPQAQRLPFPHHYHASPIITTTSYMAPPNLDRILESDEKSLDGCQRGTEATFVPDLGAFLGKKTKKSIFLSGCFPYGQK